MTEANKTAIKPNPEIPVLQEKTTAKEAAASKEKSIKYADKSAAQTELLIIFGYIKALMKPYAKGTVKERGEKPGIYSLVSEKHIETAGRKFDEIYFASIMVQKGFVGFYFMPVYTIEGVKEQLKPELMKCLKGKSCFHIKKNDAVIVAQIKDSLEIGYACYKERGWI